MVRRFLLLISFLAIASMAAAQLPPDAPPQEPPPTPKPGRVQTPAPVPIPPTVPAPPRGDLPPEARSRIRGKDLNVQVEITISDQSGGAPAERKQVSLLAADQTMGRVRANAHAHQANVGLVGTVLNVDARPFLLDNDRILLELTLEYAPLRQSPVTQQPTNLNESISVILVNGKPLTVSQAADPVSDRRMTVEVRATVLK